MRYNERNSYKRGKLGREQELKVISKNIEEKVYKPITFAVFFIFAVIAIWMVLESTSLYGTGMSPDALNYVKTAEKIIEGKGYVSYDEKPYVHWAPLLPTVLAIIGWFGVKPLVAARFLNAFCFGSIVFCSGLFFSKRIKSKLLVILGTASVLLSFTLLEVSVFAWSEPLFILFCIFFVYCISEFAKTKSWKLLIFSAIFAILASLQRYVGLGVILSGGVFIFFFTSQSRWFERVKYSAIFGIISLTPIGLWLGYNKLRADTAALFYPDTDLTIIKELQRTLGEVTPWFITENVPPNFRLAILVIIILLLIGLVLIRHFMLGRDDSEKMLTKAGVVFVVVYSVFTMTASILVNAVANVRLFSPTYVFVILLFLVGLESAAELLGRLFKAKWLGYTVVAVLCSSWLIFYLLPINNHAVEGYKKNGIGLNSVFWRSSPIIQWLNQHPIEGRIFSNEPLAIIFLTPVVAYMSPPKRISIEEFRTEMLPAKNYLVWHKRHWRTYLYDLKELNSLFRLKLVEQLPDSLIFEME